MAIVVITDGGFRSAALAGLAAKEDKIIFSYCGPFNSKRYECAKALAARYHSPLYTLNHHLTINLFGQLIPLWYAFEVAVQTTARLVYWGLQETNAIPSQLEMMLNSIRYTVEILQPLDNLETWRHGQITFETPFLHLSDAQIVAIGARYEVPWELSWDCLTSRTFHCKICEGCRQRQMAFKRARVEDPHLSPLRRLDYVIGD